MNLTRMSTEQQNPNTMNLDEMSIKEALTVLNQEDCKVAAAIEEIIPQIESAVKVIITQLNKGGD